MSRSALSLLVCTTLMSTALPATAAAPACKLKFKSSEISTGTNPQSILTDDFNKDGKLDFAQVNYNEGSGGAVNVFLGNGDGTFQAPVAYAVGAGPDALAAADLNGDGNVDFVVGNDTGASVSVLLGNGDGTFQTQQKYSVGSFPHWVTIADFNKDGAPDIAVTNEGSNTVGVLLNNGDGTFRAMQSFATATEPYSVAAGDFRRDGKIDLAVTGYYDSIISILLGKGDGTFKPHIDIPTGTAPAVITAYDFNGDHKLDLATVDYNNGETGSVSILLGNGDGTFATHIDYPTGTGPDGLALGRFNGDRNIDLAVSDLIGDTMSILPGNGDGTFGAPVNFDTEDYPLGIVAGNFHSNKKKEEDVIVTNDLSAAATVFLNKSKGCK